MAEDAVAAAVADCDAAWQHSQEQAAAAAAAERDSVWQQELHAAQQEQQSLQAQVIDTRPKLLHPEVTQVLRMLQHWQHC